MEGQGSLPKVLMVTAVWYLRLGREEKILCAELPDVSGAPWRVDEAKCRQIQLWRMRRFIPVSGCLFFISLLACKCVFNITPVIYRLYGLRDCGLENSLT